MILPTLPDTGVANQSVMYALADGTGGLPILNTNDLLGGLAKIAQEQDEYYFLGYAPSDSPDGSCHTLRVKMDHGGYKVRARTGYCTMKPKDMLAGKPVEKDLEADATNAASGAIGGTLEAPFFYTSPSEARVNVTMDVPSSSVQFNKEKGKYHADIDVLGIAYAPDGSVGARFSDQITYDFEKDEWKHFLESPMRYENQFAIAPGKYRLTVVLSAGGKDFGKYEEPLAIDPYNGKFTLSAIALSDQIQLEAGMGGEIEADLLADRTPMIVNGVQVVHRAAIASRKRTRSRSTRRSTSPSSPIESSHNSSRVSRGRSENRQADLRAVEYRSRAVDSKGQSGGPNRPDGSREGHSGGKLPPRLTGLRHHRRDHHHPHRPIRRRVARRDWAAQQPSRSRGLRGITVPLPFCCNKYRIITTPYGG